MCMHMYMHRDGREQHREGRLHGGHAEGGVGEGVFGVSLHHAVVRRCDAHRLHICICIYMYMHMCMYM